MLNPIELSLQDEVEKNTVKEGLKNTHSRRLIALNEAIKHQSFIHVDPSVINGEMPSTLSKELPLYGLIFSCKDNINTRQFPTTAGTSSLKNYYCKKSASLVIQLEQLGARLCGKNNMHELSFGVTSYNATWGNVLNPNFPAYIAGGSSGGSAVAVATGACAFSIGTDTGGSVRIPAALCGVAGFRPTTGRYARDGIVPISSTKDTPGFIANTAADIVYLDRVLTRTQGVGALQKMRVGIPSCLWENTDSDVKEVCLNALAQLKNEGIELIHYNDSELYTQSKTLQFSIPIYEFFIDFPRYLLNQEIDLPVRQFIDDLGDLHVQKILYDELNCPTISREKYIDDLSNMLNLKTQWNNLFKKHQLDVIVYPTIACTPPKIEDVEKTSLFECLIANTDLASTVGAPSMSIPISKSDQIPVGLSIDGLPNQDTQLLACALKIEEILKR